MEVSNSLTEATWIDCSGRIAIIHKARTWNPLKHDLPKYAQVKLDGQRVLLYKDREGAPHVYTTVGHDIWDQVGHLPEFIEGMEALFAEHFLDGELLAAGSSTRESVKTAIKAGDVEFQPFAANGTFGDSDALIMAKRLALYTPFTVPAICAVEDHDHVDQLMLDNKDVEGFILKTSTYGDWYKLKHEATIDVVLTGMTEGQGKYAGQVGALVCSIGDHEVANVSGMTDAVRLSLTEMGYEALAGRVLEVKYQRVGSKGRLQHPRFLRFRDDKLAKDCTLDQDTELVRILGIN